MTDGGADPEPAAGLYLHVPFCSAVCPYCDFAVATGKAEARADFTDALLAEFKNLADYRIRFRSVVFVNERAVAPQDPADSPLVLCFAPLRSDIPREVSRVAEANKGKLIGPKPPLQPKHVWAIRTRLQIANKVRDLAFFKTNKIKL